MTDKPQVIYSEGSPWFWKIFGGAVMGLISVLLLAHITNINNNIDRSFLDLRGDIKEIRQQIDGHRERLASVEQMPYKDKIVVLEKSVSLLQATVDSQTAKVAACEASLAAIREEVKVMREWDKEQAKQLQEMRDKITTITVLSGNNQMKDKKN